MDQGHSMSQDVAESNLQQKHLPAKEPFALFSALQAKNHSSVALMNMIPFLTRKDLESAYAAFGSYVKKDRDPWNSKFALFLTHHSSGEIDEENSWFDRLQYGNVALKHVEYDERSSCSYKDPQSCRLIMDSSFVASSRKVLTVVFVQFPSGTEFVEAEVNQVFSTILEIADYTKKVKNWVFSFGPRTFFNFSAKNQSLPSIIGALLSCEEFNPETLLDALVLNQDDIYDSLIEAIIPFDVRELPEHKEKFASLKLDKVKFLFMSSGMSDLHGEVNIQPAQHCDYFALHAVTSNVLSEKLSFDFQENTKIQSIKLYYDGRDMNFRLPGELSTKGILNVPCELRALDLDNREMETFDFVCINPRLYRNLTKLKIVAKSVAGRLDCGDFPNLRELLIANLHPDATIILPSTKSEPRYLNNLWLASCGGTIELGVDNSNSRGIPVPCCPLAVDFHSSCDTRKMTDLLTFSKKISLDFATVENCQEWPQFLVTDASIPFPKKTVEEYSNAKVEILSLVGAMNDVGMKSLWCLPLGSTHLTRLICRNICVKIDGNMFSELQDLDLENCSVILAGYFARLESLILDECVIIQPWVLAAPSLNKLIFRDVINLGDLSITKESSPKLEKFHVIEDSNEKQQWPTMISDGPIFPELNDLKVNIPIDKHGLRCLNISSVLYLKIRLTTDILKILKNKTFRCTRATFELSRHKEVEENDPPFYDMPLMPFVRSLSIKAYHCCIRIGGNLDSLVELIGYGKVGFAANVSCANLKIIQLTREMRDHERLEYYEALRYPMFGRHTKWLYCSNSGDTSRVIPYPETAITVPCFRKNVSPTYHFPLFEARPIPGPPQPDSEDEDASTSISVHSALNVLAMIDDQDQADRRGKKRHRDAAETRLLSPQEGEDDAADIRPRQTLRLTSVAQLTPSVTNDESPEASDSFFVSSFLNDSAFASDGVESSFPVMPSSAESSSSSSSSRS